MKRVFGYATWIASVLLMSVGSAQADAVSDFYKSKNIKMYIGAGVGGGNDTYARTFARNWKGFIPGKPNIITQNRPGAGGLTALNYLYNQGKQDGSELIVLNRSMLTYPLLDGKGVRFDINKMKWLGSLNKEISLIISWAAGPVKTFADLRTRGMMVAGTSASNDSVKLAVLMNNVLGTKFKIVAGYPSGESMNLAMVRGEVEGRASIPWTTLKATQPEWVRDKTVNILMQFGLSKHPDLPNVPRAQDLAANDEQRSILDLHAAKGEMGRPYGAPPGTPADRLAALRKSFMDAVNSPGFARDAKKLKLEVGPVSGKDMQAALKRIYATPKDVVDKARAAYNAKVKLQMAKIPIEKVSTAIVGIKRDGRRVIINKGGKKVTLRVSGSGTKVTIGGKKAKRGKLKAGMNCAFQLKATNAKSIDCK
ncbi:MAG: tripartite-type tricarboxylate transporter receptor subunit TctC [Alphaproteobacteria bacterium]|jgi:tripartite-type tricarboxylate transporter receptor subunit TctC